MDWKINKPEKTSVLHEFRPTDRCVFYVEEQHTERWQNFMINVGCFTEDSLEGCLRNWPREAIQRLRAELDKIETLLNQQEQEREASV